MEITCLTPTRLRKKIFYDYTIDCRNNQSVDSKWIIIDDGPEQSYLHGSSEEIHYEWHPDRWIKNLGGKRNYLQSLVDTEYFALVDDDDWYGSKRLETQLNWLKENPDKPLCILRDFYLMDIDLEVRGRMNTVSACYSTIMGRTSMIPKNPFIENTCSAEFNGYFRDVLWSGDELCHIFTDPPLWGYVRSFPDKPHYQMSRRENHLYDK